MLWLWAVVGCTWIPDADLVREVDADGDGVAAPGDCDDSDASVSAEQTWYADEDADGFGSAVSTTACGAPDGFSAETGDCDDGDATVYPGAEETDCADPVDRNCDGSAGGEDADADGWPACQECDDGDPSVNPDAEERCDGVDDDCEGTVDEGATDASTFYLDSDGDGVGGEVTASACRAPDGYTEVSGDCDDTNASVTAGSTWYSDVDGDGSGDDGTAVDACVAPDGNVSEGGDCDDADPSAHPDAPESCDDAVDLNCDGSVGRVDADGDGWAACEECDDGDAAVNPGATEVCDGVDDDCEGTVDEGASDASPFYVDADADGYGGSSVVYACDPAAGVAENADDCDDADAAVFPGAAETCQGVDDDCDGEVDEGVLGSWYTDADADGYGSGVATLACSAPAGTVADADDCDDTDAAVNPDGVEVAASGADEDCDGEELCYADDDGDGHGASTLVASTNTGCDGEGEAAASDDCDDADPAVSPSATEVAASGVDEDCDGSELCYADIDGDGYGSATLVASADTACDASGEADDAEDCDDGDAATFPGAAASDSASACTTDHDGDGYGAATAPTGGEAGSDCDDTDAGRSPAASETVANGADEDCDGGDSCWEDADGDGYGSTTEVAGADLDCLDPGEASDDTDCADGDAATFPGAAEADSTTACATDADGDGYGSDAPATGIVAGTDCDDASAVDHPGASETPDNGDDDDCDRAEACYTDADADGYGTSAVVASADSDCTDAGEADDADDCDDADAAVSPGATETCATSGDDDCDGDANELGATACTTYHLDADGDLFGTTSSVCSCVATGSYTAATSTDCDDGDGAVNPAATETCDEVDDDCDGVVDDGVTSTFYADADGDGYGGTGTTAACSAPSGYVADATDCDDTDAAVSPGDPEVCSDGEDDDCDGYVDENCGAYDGTYENDVDRDVELWGESADDRLGRAVASGFDHDGDGYEDVLVAAPDDDDGGTSDPGAIYLLEGPVASGQAHVSSRDYAKRYNDYSSLSMGEQLWGVPDLDGDGYDEIASVNRSSSYLIRLWAGPLASGTRAATSDDWFTVSGYDLSSAGDYDPTTSDHEVVVGYTSGSTRGQVRIYATTGSMLTSFNGESSVGDAAGRAVAGGPDCDVDGDGQTDIFVSDSMRDVGSVVDAGAAYLILGGALGTESLAGAENRIDGGSTSGEFGDELRVDDTDGDGTPDLWVGEPSSDAAGTNAGAVYLFTSARTDGSATDAAVTVLGSSAYYNVALSAVGDANGDGETDLLVGSDNATSGTNKGAAWLIYGPLAGTYSLDVHGSGGYNAVFLGSSVDDSCAGNGEAAAFGDLDGDGSDEILVGCDSHDGGGADAGVLFIFQGG